MRKASRAASRSTRARWRSTRLTPGRRPAGPRVARPGGSAPPPPPPQSLELLAPALGHGGLEALLAHTLEERSVGFCLDDSVELAAIGRDEAHAVDLQIVDAPPTVPKVEPVIERDLAAAIREDLRPHRGVARVDRFPEVRDVLARVRLDPGDVGALEQVGEERHELGPLIGRACGPVARESTPRHFLEIEELTREPPDLGTSIRRLPCRRLGFHHIAGLQQRGPAARRRLPRLSP